MKTRLIVIIPIARMAEGLALASVHDPAGWRGEFRARLCSIKDATTPTHYIASGLHAPDSKQDWLDRAEPELATGGGWNPLNWPVLLRGSKGWTGAATVEWDMSADPLTVENMLEELGLQRYSPLPSS